MIKNYNNTEFFNVITIDLSQFPLIRIFVFSDIPGEALEELAHRQEVQLVRAVEDYALNGERLREVLRRFRFTGSGWASWRTAELQMQSAGQRQVASIGQRSDHESPRVAQVLVPSAEEQSIYTTGQKFRITMYVGVETLDGKSIEVSKDDALLEFL